MEQGWKQRTRKRKCLRIASKNDLVVFWVSLTTGDGRKADEGRSQRWRYRRQGSEVWEEKGSATSFPGSSLYLEKEPRLCLVICLLDFSRFQRSWLKGGVGKLKFVSTEPSREWNLREEPRNKLQVLTPCPLTPSTASCTLFLMLVWANETRKNNEFWYF